MQVLRDLMTLSKFGIAVFVSLTSAMGYILAGGHYTDRAFALVVIGTGLVSAAAGAFNQVLEYREDARMQRTRHRPIPAGRMRPTTGLLVGSVLLVAGEGLLIQCGVFPPIIALAAFLIYVGIYTPLKRLTWWCNVTGAVAGALPPVIGWSAKASPFTHGAFIIFTILWLWQWPHLMAIGWMFREDFERAGFAVPDSECGHRLIARLVLLASFLSWGVTLLPAFYGLTGKSYFFLAFMAGATYVFMTYRFIRQPTPLPAHSLFKTSLLYLAVICIGLMSFQTW